MQFVGPCSDNNGGCEEVCFNLGKNEITCFCPFGRLASDGKHCEGQFSFFCQFWQILSDQIFYE